MMTGLLKPPRRNSLNFVPIDIGQTDVKQDQIDAIAADEFEPFGRRRCELRLEFVRQLAARLEICEARHHLR